MRLLHDRARAPLAAALLVLAALLATTDERSFGAIPDGREMLSAAAGLATGEGFGVSREFANAVPRPGGDASSRYGAGQSLVEVPFVLAARLLGAFAPAASSAPVLVLLPVGLLAVAAAALARAAADLGASAPVAAASGAGLVLASPLWGYAGSDFSEPLQTAALALALAGAVRLRRGGGEGWRSGAATGAALALAGLAKSLLWLPAAPVALLALRPPPGARSGGTEEEERAKRKERKRLRRTTGRAAEPAALPLRPGVAAGLGVGAAVWALLELLRFGRLLGGYGGEDFAYPPLTGLLRLTLLPNKGLLWYAPFAALAPLGFVRLWREARDVALVLLAGTLAVLLPVSAWWAWDGQAGWGPRLLVPALPFLFLAATVAWRGEVAAAGGEPRTPSRAVRALAPVLLAAGVGVNLVGALVPFAGVYALSSGIAPQPISEARAAGTPYEVERRADGVLLASAAHHLSLTPAWSPIRVHAALLAERLRGGDVAARIEATGLDSLEPRFAPAFPRVPAPALVAATTPFRWPFWGRSWLAPQPGLDDPLAQALRDQAVRAADRGRTATALRLAVAALARTPAKPDPAGVAVAADAALRLGRADEARALLSRTDAACHPWILYVKIGLGDPPGDCVPTGLERSFTEGALAARAAGLPVAAWDREVRRGAAAEPR